MQELEQYLWSLTVDDVKKIKKKVKVSCSGSTKQDIITAIMDFYKTPNWIEDYYKTLEGFDKEYTDLIVQQNFHPIRDEVTRLADKYNVKRDWYGRIEDNLKFMIRGSVPFCFRETLLKLVPPLELVFTPLKEDEYIKDNISIEESKNPIKKFDALLMFINKNKVKATEKNNCMQKSSILKFIKENNIHEIVRRDSSSLEDLKNQNDTIIMNGIVSILLCSKVIAIKQGYFILGSNYSKYINLSPVDKAKFMLEEYINCSHAEINEINRLTNYVYKITYPLNLIPPRQTIIDYVKKMPIDKWISIDQMKYFVRIQNMGFLRDNAVEILQKDDYENWYYNSSFEDLEHSFIDSILMDYLAVLGIIDICIDNSYNDRGERYYLWVDFAKLGDFGAKVLGLIESKNEEIEETPLIITPKFEIIAEGSKRMEYELYFERFFDKISADSKRTIYKLNFEGLAKSYDIEATNCLEYILKECPNIPENVHDRLNEWVKTLGKINIKTVTILEAPPEILKELIKDSKFQKLLPKEKTEHVIIPSKNVKDIKKEIERREYFCSIDN